MDKSPSYSKGFFDHPCSAPGCDVQGAFGEGVNLLAGRLGVWFCGGHWRARRNRPPPEPAQQCLPDPPKTPAQGRLL